MTEPLNIRYLSGIPDGASALLVLRGGWHLFVDRRFPSPLERMVFPGIALHEAEELPRLLRRFRRCGFEGERVTVQRKARWKKNFQNTKFIHIEDTVEQFRRQKEKAELQFLRRAHRITREVLRKVPSVLHPGIREEELARRLRIWALERGAEDLSFDPIVAFGTNTGYPHHRPTSRALRRGNIVQIDVGARVEGYCADMSRVFFTVSPAPEERRVHDALLRAQKRATAQAKAGVSTHALDQAAREVLAAEHLEAAFCHALGHGVGLEIHEGVTLSQKRPAVQLLSGEVITIEPGVYLPGHFGMRVEDMVYIA